jgi:flagellar hook protein FlgE
MTAAAERTDVDIATEFAWVILTQRAHSPTVEMVTTAAQMRQTVFTMVI